MRRVIDISSQGLQRLLCVAGAMVLLAACTARPVDDSAFYPRGGAEALLDVSSEVVNLGIGSKQEVRQLGEWIAADHPTRAEVFCVAKDKSCADAKALLRAKKVDVGVTDSPENVVTLVYERILARDCNPRFIDRRSDLNNEPSPALGCALSANIVQHVSNKRDFVAPALMDSAPASAAVGTYYRAYAPPEKAEKYSVEETAVKTKTE